MYVLEANGQENAWLPPSGFPLKLKDVAVAKIYKNASGHTVLGLIRSGMAQSQKGEVRTKLETRTRTVTDQETGNEKNETYQVQVPYAEVMTVFERRPSRIEIPILDTKIWKLRGNVLSRDDAQQLLKEPKRCLFLDNPKMRLMKNPVPPFLAEMLRDDVVVVWFDSNKVTVIEQQNQKNRRD